MDKKEQPSMDILVSLNQKYMPQLRVMLTSLYLSQPDTRCRIYLLHRSIAQEELEALQKSLEKLEYTLFPVRVEETLFKNAPVTKRYPQEMYYRLLAAQLLPKELKRVLYLDPDTLIINPLMPLWTMDMKGNLFAAAAHTGKTELANSVNKLRLGTERNYYNSGVLLIDLHRCAEEVDAKEIFSYVETHGKELLLPDQDVLNVLYSSRTLELDDALWNYDARNFGNYLLRSHGEADIPWVMKNTAILHFCGKAKPWKTRYVNRFGVLYRHYMQLAGIFLP